MSLAAVTGDARPVIATRAGGRLALLVKLVGPRGLGMAWASAARLSRGSQEFNTDTRVP